MERKPDDQQWVRRLKSDGPERDQALEELRSVMLRGLSRSLDGRYGERFNAEDVVQDALMKVLNSLDKFEGRSRFTTWAMAIATRVGISSLRRKHFKDVSLDAISAEGEARIEIAVDEAQTPDNQLDQSAILSKLKEMIANLLTDKQRTAIRGMLEGMPVEGLENARVKYDLRSGVEVDDHLRTTNARVYAAGDVASRFKFTHAADFMARIVIKNALFKGRARASKLVIPWATYTSPELAHVGLTEQQAKAEGVEVDTFTQPFDTLDRAILDGETEGFARVHVRKGTGKIVGATIVAEHAGDMIGELSLAMTNGIGLGAIASSIHPYPTQAEAIRKLGDQYKTP